MSGDPLEESGQQARQGIVQALQTAHTTAALMRGRGGESRSRDEHDQRLAHAENREARSKYEHTVRVDTTILEADSKVAVNQARVEEIRGRMTINEKAQDLSQRETEARMGRSDQDLARRDRLGEQQYRHNQQVHDAKIGGYEGRETRAVELHELDVEYKELLINIRRRAAGFTETLSGEGDIGQTGASAAAFAAADAERDLSEDHTVDADAFDERFAEDTGRAFADVIDVETVDFDFDGDSDTTADSGINGEPDEVTEPEYPHHVSLDAVRGLAEELTAEIHLAHAAAALLDPETDLTPADAVTEAVDAALGEGFGDGPAGADKIDRDPGETAVLSAPVSEPDL